ncbi:MAG: CRISPR system precrRNA processing endoribonuclease RAMP protein Cas6, partial [Dehalococcoidia bacterium]|nr:CRISPR system precrRNA processing endoribonuclease RAMP protein Cas6 [Dehalococcoidia bacterium]
SYRLSTRLASFGDYSETGFFGHAVYECPSASDEERRLINTLADFAFFAGVGAKTTMGMGQCRRLALTRSNAPDRG